ncbi:hypothetical protein DV738_g2118, partial [Chaetothyriales sp. CBS 135597]
MRVSAVLLLKNLLTRLHPPAPATERESARLLAVLDHAFRKQLDAAHPPPPPEDQQQSHVPTQPSRAVNRHLESLLLHPLLETKPSRPAAHGPTLRTAVDQFDHALRTRTLTVTKLKSISRQYLVQTKSKPSAEKLGPRLAAWLEAENAQTKSTFFQSADVIHDVVPLMYADGLESTVWAWLRSLYQCEWLRVGDTASSAQTPAFLHAQDILVSEMMRMAIRRGSIQDAAAQYVAAAVYRAQSAPTEPLTSSYKRITTAILHKRHRHGIDTSTFEQVLDHAISFSRDRVVTRSFLQLYHPTSPTAETLFHELSNDSFAGPWHSWHRKHKLLHAALLNSVLDAAQLSLEQSKFKHASFFLDLAETQWPDYLGASSSCAKSTTANHTSIITSRLHRARQLLASHASIVRPQLAPT